MNTIIQGDCLESLKKLEDNSIDAIVTDPPYGLSFMGKRWDYDVPSVEIWEECLRVLKPGGHLLAFAGTRTQHRIAVRIEDAGFEIRDMIAWVYGSGFPKSLNIGKAVDRLQGNERIGTGEIKHHAQKGVAVAEERGAIGGGAFGQAKDEEITIGTSEWEGWGTALKPALEPITVARKPIEGTVAENCLKWGVGGINIDESRVDVADSEKVKQEGHIRKGNVVGDNRTSVAAGQFGDGAFVAGTDLTNGRFPANLIHDNSEEVRECFPSVGSKSIPVRKTSNTGGTGNVYTTTNDNVGNVVGYGDQGNASRFFKSIIYQAKASKSERNKGLDSYVTVKYNGDICKEENMVVVQLLQKVILEQELVSFSTGESGESLMVQFPKDSSYTIKTTINKIMTSQILNLLMLSLTNESTQDVRLEKVNGGNLAENVESLKKWILTITNDNQELALGVSRVALQMLLQINNEENWKEATNFHSTVKPISLMEYLVKLVSKEGHTILDPFAGSGSTLIACKKLKRNYIGMELDPEYIKIAEARLNAIKEENTLF